MKNPRRVEAGKAGARKRWGDEPRTVRIDDLMPSQRRLVLALVESLREENANVAGRITAIQVGLSAKLAGHIARSGGLAAAQAVRGKRFQTTVVGLEKETK